MPYPSRKVGGTKALIMNKLEKHIKTTLEKRRITPSASAWQRVSNAIETPKKNNRSAILWVAAAAVVLFVSIGVFRSVHRFTKQNNVQIVNQSLENNSKHMPIQKTNEEGQNQGVTLTESETIMPKNKADNTLKSIKITESVVSKPLVVQQDSQFLHNPLVAEVSEKEIQKIEFTKDPIAQKLEEVMTQIALLEKTQNITEAEIDSLLMEAQRALLLQGYLQTPKPTDAQSLLAEVEMELLEESQFPLFNRLKDEFFKLRTAVADRNN